MRGLTSKASLDLAQVRFDVRHVPNLLQRLRQRHRDSGRPDAEPGQACPGTLQLQLLKAGKLVDLAQQ